MANEVLDNRDTAIAGARPDRIPPYILKYGGIGKLAVLALALLVTLAACSSSSSSSTAGGTLDAAYNFPFTLYQGESELGGSDLNLADLGGKPVVLNFWAGLCPPCRAEMPDLQLFYEEFKDDVTLIGIDIGQYLGLGNQTDAQNLLNDLGVTYPAGFTNDDRVIRLYEVFGMPTTVFITSKGEIFRQWGGLLNLEVLADISNEMLAQEPT
jgi:thiol-disulfide isomerase/thioredoxin